MKMYNVSIGGMIIRFHLLAAFIVVMGFAGFLYVGIVLGMIIFLATIMGIQFNPNKKEEVSSQPSDAIFSTDHHFSLIRNHIPAHRYQMWHKRHHWTAH